MDEIAGINYIKTKINGKSVKLVSSFFKPQEIVNISDISVPGVYGGTNIFDPTQYTVNGIANPSDNTSGLEAYYKKLIGDSVNSKKPVILSQYDSASRPEGTKGLMIYDTTINKTLIFNGTNWIDQAGRVS